ncbi:hypothetical protein [Streptomyces sp. NPDC048659]|uniref:hypothetical protein n=1 Tax=Streptomyces sp. NPDC048659 TaxID=3155489 RepID=UPI0034259D1F
MDLPPPAILTGTWWILAAVSTAIFLVVCFITVPVRRYRIRLACAPLFGLFYLPAAAGLRGHDLNTVLAIHALTMMSVAIGIVGRGKDLKEMYDDKRLYGKGSSPPRLTAQFLASGTLAIGVLLWLGGAFSGK